MFLLKNKKIKIFFNNKIFHLSTVGSHVGVFNIVFANVVQNIERVVFYTPFPGQFIQIVFAYVLIILFPQFEIFLADDFGREWKLLCHVNESSVKKLKRQTTAYLDNDAATFDRCCIVADGAFTATKLFSYELRIN